MASRPNLFQGATGPAVKEVQQRMAALGFYQGPVDGKYGPDIAGAAVKLQRQEKLSPVNGGFYEACWDALDRLEAKANKPPPPPPPAQAQPKPLEPPPMKPAPKPGPPKPLEPPPMKPAPPKPGPPKPLEPPPMKPAPQKPPQPPPMKPGAAHPYLVQSMRGEAVSDLQRRLKALCLYAGPISGVYSPQTAASVVALQRQFKLSPINGGMTPPTWTALESLEAQGSGAAPQSDGGLTSGTVQVSPPSAASFSNLRWKDLTLSPCSDPQMQADAPGLEGKQVYFVVDLYGADGRWSQAAVLPGKVQGGKASAAWPDAAKLPPRTRLRFRVEEHPPAGA